MILVALIAVAAAAPLRRDCPIAATAVLPELVGSWQLLMISGLDRDHPDSVRASATIAPELQRCLLRENLSARSGTPRYQALILWGVNGPDSSIQRVFTHSLHGRLGVYQGRRAQSTIALRQLSFPPQPDGVAVENLVVIEGKNRFTITSRITNDGGTSWQSLSRWEYARAGSQNR